MLPEGCLVCQPSGSQIGGHGCQPLLRPPLVPVSVRNSGRAHASCEWHHYGISSVWVPGAPAVFWGSGDSAWRLVVSGCRFASQSPAMTFVVSAWRRRGHRFDLENLVVPVLSALQLTPESLWATVELGMVEGVRLWEHVPPAPNVVPAAEVYLANPPRSSKAGLPVVEELKMLDALGTDEPLGLELLFDDPNERFGPYAFKGSTKAIIDALGPLLGWRSAKSGGLADDRIRDLRIRRGVNPSAKGVRIRVWYLAETTSEQLSSGLGSSQSHTLD